jgi:hypothetical protein
VTCQLRDQPPPHIEENTVAATVSSLNAGNFLPSQVDMSTWFVLSESTTTDHSLSYSVQNIQTQAKPTKQLCPGTH